MKWLILLMLLGCGSHETNKQDGGGGETVPVVTDEPTMTPEPGAVPTPIVPAPLVCDKPNMENKNNVCVCEEGYKEVGVGVCDVAQYLDIGNFLHQTRIDRWVGLHKDSSDVKPFLDKMAINREKPTNIRYKREIYEKYDKYEVVEHDNKPLDTRQFYWDVTINTNKAGYIKYINVYDGKNGPSNSVSINAEGNEHPPYD